VEQAVSYALKPEELNFLSSMLEWLAAQKGERAAAIESAMENRATAVYVK